MVAKKLKQKNKKPIVRAGVTGRGSKGDWSEDWQDEFVLKIEDGASMRQVAGKDGLPSRATILRALDADEAFAKRYAVACEGRADKLFDDCLSIADGARLDKDAIAKARLRIDARKWAASKLAPVKYGDRIAVNASFSGETLTAEEQSERLVAMIPVLNVMLGEQGFAIVPLHTTTGRQIAAMEHETAETPAT